MIDKNTILENYWMFHPKFIFFKTLPENSILLDVGAGNGGLVHFKKYMYPKRDDIRMYAVDLYEGQWFYLYDGFKILDLEHDDIPFPEDFFNAAVISHVIEHIHKPYNLLNNLKKLIKKGGLVYVEYPGPLSVVAPSRKKYRNLCSTLNFYDDSSHVSLYDQKKISRPLWQIRIFLYIWWINIKRLFTGQTLQIWQIPKR